MNLHIVGGFLGSGKTTAIIHASKQLKQDGKKVAVVTNDQGNYLIDTSFVTLNNIPAAEVTNGCFCCNFNMLGDQIKSLKYLSDPDFIFAESVGSCTDLVATVVKPMQLFNKNLFDRLTFTVFADCRILLDYLLNKKLPFSDEVSYIFLKQLEEADLIVINKTDLLSAEDQKILEQLTDPLFNTKAVIFQNSLDPVSIKKWLATLGSLPARQREPLKINYEIYGKGEANLAWLDDEITIQTNDHSAWDCAIRFIETVVHNIGQKQINIGHLKFLLTGGTLHQKISFTTIADGSWKNDIQPCLVSEVHLMINARIETSPGMAAEIIQAGISAISVHGVTVRESRLHAFKPGFPTPTYRIEVQDENTGE